MEDIAPTHHFILFLREGLCSGVSLTKITKEYMNSYQNSVTPLLVNWVIACRQGEDVNWLLKQNPLTEYQISLFQLMFFARGGGSILKALEDLEKEVRQASRIQLDRYMAVLPLKLMVPLLLFQFPALLILILGPLLMHLIKEVQ